MIIGPEQMIEPSLVKVSDHVIKRNPRTIRKPNPDFDPGERFRPWDPGGNWYDISKNLHSLRYRYTYTPLFYSSYVICNDPLYVY